MGNKNALRPDKGERRRTVRTFAVPPCFCRRLAATASEGANTPRSGNGNTRRPLLTLLTFHGHGSRGSFRGPTRRFAPATGSLTSGIARTFLVRCPIILRLLPSVYTMEPGDASSHNQRGSNARKVIEMRLPADASSNPVLSRGIHAAKLAYSHHCPCGLTVVLGVLNDTEQQRSADFIPQLSRFSANIRQWTHPTIRRLCYATTRE